jgi:hypothetical protein
MPRISRKRPRQSRVTFSESTLEPSIRWRILRKYPMHRVMPPALAGAHHTLPGALDTRNVRSAA